MENTERKIRLITSNKRAYHDYEVVQRVECGLVLQGTEVKSLRAGKANLQDAYASFTDKISNDLYLLNLHIAEYDFGNIANHKPKRPRKLLVSHREAIKLRTAVNEKGLTLIPLSIYFSGPYVKVELGLVRAKKKYDKREDLKMKDAKLEIDRKFRYK
ncbi:MAG: SsrA-binding protein [Ignavibacteria bacterium GWF2_33_9]|nr:MAG: SsrA-binding protein [Ignavibacteria bacterium GWF2_33_9]